MQLVADRFALAESGDAVDLATGARVRLVVDAAGDVPQQLQWSERCETLYSLHHHAIAPLVDFGLTGPASRFEAWTSGSAWTGSPDEADAVRERARAFLGAVGLSVGSGGVERVLTSERGVGIWVPDQGTGYPAGSDAAGFARLPLVEHGIRLIERPAVAALAEMFRVSPGSRPQMASVWAPPESGKRTAIRGLARAARLQGLVPVAVHLLDSVYAALWERRSLLVISLDAASSPWTSFLTTAMRVTQPHVFLIGGETECRGVDGVPLAPVSADALADAVRPCVAGGPFDAAVRKAAEHARGLPGRFARRLWRRGAARDRWRPLAHRFMMAAEQPAEYGGDNAAVAPAAAPAASANDAWPMPGELASLRRALAGAQVYLAAGRHAPGIRGLRQATSGLARRHAWTDAAEGGVHLAAALLQRGRPADAQKAIDEAREYAAHGGADGLLIDLAVLSGEAWIDRARLDEAENILATALTAGRAAADPSRVAGAAVAMSRCLFWSGRFAEAAAALQRCPSTLSSQLMLRRATISSRIAVAAGDVSGAMASATAAVETATAAGSGSLKAAAFCARGMVYLAIADFDAAERDIALSIAEAHGAHDPLRALRARLLRAEVERRRGRLGTAIAQMGRLRRAAASATPLLRVRWQLTSALCARPDTAAAAIVERQVAATGLRGLAVFASVRESHSAAASGGDPFLDHVVAILRVCQTADDDAVVLKDVCVRVRQHLHAAAVAFVAIREGHARIIAADGAQIDTDIAKRATSSTTTVAPHRRDDRVEAAAPVLYGGAPIAAICARWTLGSTYDLSRAASALAMTAAAAAPVVALAIEARQPRQDAGDCELLGFSTPMVDLRRSVGSAAAAPFPVLIDGDSGSGKELVARAIHRGGARRHKPFCTLNCAALPDDLVEAELFGHARGSFTGAILDRAGVFEDAHGGTLFLDEIGELSPRAQAKVLRVIQEGELRRVGETASRRVDVRIVSATNRDLRREVETGRFRLDLLYRLDVIRIPVPRLRDRRDDVPLLAEHFWRDATTRVGSRASLGAATIAALMRYDWPGNVRELQNVLAALAVRCPKRGVVPPTALPPVFAGGAAPDASRLDEARRTFEERFVRATLVRTGGHRGRAAEELGVTRQGLTKLMSRLGILSNRER